MDSFSKNFTLLLITFSFCLFGTIYYTLIILNSSNILEPIDWLLYSFNIIGLFLTYTDIKNFYEKHFR